MLVHAGDDTGFDHSAQRSDLECVPELHGALMLGAPRLLNCLDLLVSRIRITEPAERALATAISECEIGDLAAGTCGGFRESEPAPEREIGIIAAGVVGAPERELRRL